MRNLVKSALTWLALLGLVAVHCQAQQAVTGINVISTANSSTIAKAAVAAKADAAVKPSSPSGYRIFTKDDQFTVPWGKYNIRVLLVGGGGGGGCGHTGGGGSGYVISTTRAVSPGDTFAVRVGKGGAGAARNNRCERALDACNELIGQEDGGESSFGYIRVAGGKAPRGRFVGGDGGSGGGAGGGAGAGCDQAGCIGGSDGSDGANCHLGYYTWDYTAPKGGTGQGKGTFSSQLSIFRGVTAAEAGPRASNEIWMAGSGGSGVKINNAGPSGGRGAGLIGGSGGIGYGGGGGAGGFTIKFGDREPGGRGADGVVYVEWD